MRSRLVPTPVSGACVVGLEVNFKQLGLHSVIVEAKYNFVMIHFIAKGAIRAQAASVSNLDFPCLHRLVRRLSKTPKLDLVCHERAAH